MAYGHEWPVGFELCGGEAETCRWADARIEGDAVVLDAVSPEGADDATRVRYGWADSPICTLYDGAGLPAIPFEVRIEPAQ